MSDKELNQNGAVEGISDPPDTKSTSPLSMAFEADDPGKAETGRAEFDQRKRRFTGRRIVGRPLVGRRLVGRPPIERRLIGRPPKWRSITRNDVKPLVRAEVRKPAQAFDTPQFPSSAEWPSTTSSDAINSASDLTPAEPAKEEEKASDSPKKRKKRRAKPEIDLAVIDKIVREGGRFLTEREVAVTLAISMSVMRNWRVAGRGPKMTRIGTRAVRFDPADVREFVERGRK